ncbi:phage tail protein [Francisella sp. TX07-6608]|uniref:phage tail protein n=1 Tax=Francisella sp. TX07-6608 TaxID=573568 RepID=UPI000911B534|nr:phage tail protein [Francisella sp. TX07-6608]OIN82884.1 phage Tail Collar domain protein [Francisella sp. TX07-6608]
MLKYAQQKGNIVLGALLLLAILTVISLAYYKHLQWQRLQDSAKALGNKLAMVVDALEKKLSFDEKFSTGNYTIKDLINKSCGGNANEDYLPCNFNLSSQINNGEIEIAVTQSQSNAQVRLASITTSTIGIYNHQNANYQPVSYLAGAVLAAAQSSKAFSGNQYLSAAVSYDLDSPNAKVIANIVANQNNGNIFLRVDGSNKMQNSLSFNQELNKEQRMIKYVSALVNDKELQLDANKIYLGNQSGVKGNSNVIVNDLTIHSMGDQPLSSLLNSMPVGSVISYAGGVAPSGYFECNGASFDTNKYPKLYQALGDNKVPDLRGVFVRGWDHGRGVDINRGVNSYQDDAIRNITGRVGFVRYQSPLTQEGALNFIDGGNSVAANGPNRSGAIINFDASRVVPTASENRPKNVALMYIIKHD